MSGFRCTKPVAFLIFNRPECTERVFQTIRRARPPRLYVVADGPRAERAGESAKCAAARGVITRDLDWPCEVRTLYSDANLGCRKRISGGLDWVFEQEEEAIILEDDCLPHPTFFRFCEELLDYYRDDRRIMIISGTNQRLDHRFVKHSYLFGSTGHIWGWASWRRAWKYYDVDMRVWPQVRKEKWLLGLNSTLRTRQTVRQWEKALDDVYSGRVDTWDWQWNLACWLQRGASIIAAQNLVSNIGFGAASTHTGETSSADSERLAYEARFPLTHPLYMAGDALYEQEPRDVEYRFQALKHKIKFRSDGARRFRRFSGS